MRTRCAVAMLAFSVVSSGCADARNPAGPEESRLKWGWDQPLGTGTPAPPSMSCSSPNSFLGTAVCTATNLPPTGLPSWSFVTDNGVSSTGGGSGSSWSGVMIASGTATVTFTDQNNAQQTLSAPITVPRRTASWVPVVGGTAAVPGVIDSCVNFDWDGLTASKNCTSPYDADQFFIPKVASLGVGSGYSLGQVTGSGPNAGLWFINQMTASMDLRSQVSVRFRNPGTKNPLAGAPLALRTACANAFPQQPSADRSQHEANSACTSNSVTFNAAVTCLWGHEARHLNAGVAAAKWANNDVYALWEGIVRGSQAALVDAAKNTYEGAHLSVRGIMLAAEDTGPLQHFSGWWWVINGGWANQNYSQYC